MIKDYEQSSLSCYDEEIDLKDLVKSLWSGKWWIIAITAVASTIALVVAVLTPNEYRAEALISPAHNEAAGGLSALAAQYGGLASLAGIELAKPSSNKAALALEVLQSRKFLSEFIDRHDILVPLMAAKGWRSESNEVVIDPDIYDIDSETWVRKASPPRQSKPSVQETYIELSNRLSVDENASTGFVKVAVTHYSPQIAKQWVDWLIEDLNATMMATDVAEAKQAIDFLNEQISRTSVADLQSVFFRLIEEQTKTMMLARVSPEYMFRTVDPAVIPELKAKPNRALIAVLGLIVGIVVGVIIVLMRHGIASSHNRI